MKRIVTDFLNSAKQDQNILKIFFLEYPKFFETLVIIEESNNLNFKERSELYKNKFVHFSSFNFVIYTKKEWNDIEKNNHHFLETIKDFGELIYDKNIFNKLKIFSKNKKKESPISEAINQAVESNYSLKMFAKSLKIAGEEDFLVAKILFKERFFKHSVFFCQQSVEKFLKSKLHFFGTKSFKVHNFDILLSSLSKHLPDIINFKNEVEKLESLYLITRYPPFGYSSKMGESISISESNSKKYIDLVEKIYKFLF